RESYSRFCSMKMFGNSFPVARTSAFPTMKASNTLRRTFLLRYLIRLFQNSEEVIHRQHCRDDLRTARSNTGNSGIRKFKRRANCFGSRLLRIGEHVADKVFNGLLAEVAFVPVEQTQAPFGIRIRFTDRGEHRAREVVHHDA